jgi:hypothetical protein
MSSFLGVFDPPKEDRTLLLIEIFTSAFKSGLNAIIFREEKLLYKITSNSSDLEVTREAKTAAYKVLDESQFESASKLVSTTNPWHKNSFLVMFGKVSLVEECASKLGEIAGLTVPEMQKLLENEIDGYMFPVDDELIVYGTESLLQVLKTFPEFEVD